MQNSLILHGKSRLFCIYDKIPRVVYGSTFCEDLKDKKTKNLYMTYLLKGLNNEISILKYLRQRCPKGYVLVHSKDKLRSVDDKKYNKCHTIYVFIT
jgi:hypothetical protein